MTAGLKVVPLRGESVAGGRMPPVGTLRVKGGLTLDEWEARQQGKRSVGCPVDGCQREGLTPGDDVDLHLERAHDTSRERLRRESRRASVRGSMTTSVPPAVEVKAGPTGPPLEEVAARVGVRLGGHRKWRVVCLGPNAEGCGFSSEGTNAPQATSSHVRSKHALRGAVLERSVWLDKEQRWVRVNEKGEPVGERDEDDTATVPGPQAVEPEPVQAAPAVAEAVEAARPAPKLGIPDHRGLLTRALSALSWALGVAQGSGATIPPDIEQARQELLAVVSSRGTMPGNGNGG